MQVRTAWMEPVAVSDTFQKIERYRTDDFAILQLLEDYLRDEVDLFDKAAIELRLTAHLIEAKCVDGLERLDFHEQVASRPSDALLSWTVNQRRQQPSAPPSPLVNGRELTGDEAVLFARAFLLWPQNPALRDGVLQKNLVTRIRPWRTALWYAAIAFADAGADPLAVECAHRWLRNPLPVNDLPERIAGFFERKALAGCAVEALRSAAICHPENPTLLLNLAQIGFECGCYAEALYLVEVVAPRLTDTESRRLADALSLASLASLNNNCGSQSKRVQAVLDGYRARWMCNEAAFPYPQSLLRLAHGPDESDLREHLLNHCTLDDTVPLWVRLEHLDARRRWSETIPKWLRLWHEQPRDTYLLIGLTEAVLGARAAGERVHLEAIEELPRCWESLTSTPGWREAAWSVLLLLTDDSDRVIEIYETYLANAPLSRRLANGCTDIRATYAYVKSLTWRHRWDKLLSLFEQPDISLLRYVCSFGEYHFFRLLSEIERLPDKEDAVEIWWRLWEKLICLPLNFDQLRLVLAHFTTTRRQLERDGHPVALSETGTDIALQLLRRGKALGEYLLYYFSGSEADREIFRDRLKQTGLDGLPELLKELERYRRVSP